MASQDDAYAVELSKCAADYGYFIDTHGVIEDAQGTAGGVGGVARFRLWPAQVLVCWQLMVHRLTIILKARQLGISWIVCGYALWLCLFRPGQLVLLFSKNEAAAIELLRRIKALYRRLPDWMRARLPSQVDDFPLDVDQDNTTLFGFSNGSRCQSLPATKGAGRSEAASLIVVDEAAWLPWPMDLYTSIKPAVDNGGRLVMLSSANGIGELFHWLWVRAESGLNEFAAIFLPWWARPGRDAAWYAKILAESPDPALVKQEYPATATEAFVTSGRVRFDAAWVEAQAANALEPIPARDWPVGPLLEPDGRPKLGPDGKQARGRLPFVPGFVLFKVPPAGSRLALAADVAEGLDGRDYSAAPLIDIETWEEFGEIHGHPDPDVYGDHLHTLAEFFDAMILVERNNHGGTTLARLKALKSRRVVAGWDGRPGWVTNTRTKPLAVDALATALRDNLTKVRSRAALAELRIYQCKPDGGTGSPEGYHDDRVMARAIFFGAVGMQLMRKRRIEVT